MHGLHAPAAITTLHDIDSTINSDINYSSQHGLVQWCQHASVTNYVDQQTLKPDDDYVLPHQRLWTFDVLACPLSAAERFLLQPLICGTVFHRTSLLPPISPYSTVVS